jgi:hypothetical protein
MGRVYEHRLFEGDVNVVGRESENALSAFVELQVYPLLSAFARGKRKSGEGQLVGLLKECCVGR